MTGKDYVLREVERIDGRKPAEDEIGRYYSVWFHDEGKRHGVGHFWKGLLLFVWWGDWLGRDVTLYFWNPEKYWPDPPVDPRPS